MTTKTFIAKYTNSGFRISETNYPEFKFYFKILNAILNEEIKSYTFKVTKLRSDSFGNFMVTFAGNGKSFLEVFENERMHHIKHHPDRNKFDFQWC